MHLERGTERSTQQLLRARLSVRPHDADDPSPPCTSAISSELAERRECVVTLVARNAQPRRTARIADHDCTCTSRYGLCEEVVPVERRPLQRDEPAPLGQRPPVRMR